MKQKSRRIQAVVFILGAIIGWLIVNPESYESLFTKTETEAAAETAETDTTAEAITVENPDAPLAVDILGTLEVKGRAPKTGYSREEFYSGWPTIDGCSLRQRILKRDFGNSAVLDGCNVVAGEYEEPYTGEYRIFTDRSEITKIQIDHVVALSDAWQKGAQNLTAEERYAIATDPLNLLAVDGPANNQKSDSDAASWLPSNKKFRCQYVARQVSVKSKYHLWVTEAEKQTIAKVLENCPTEPAVGI